MTPTEGDAPGCKASIFVTGSWPPEDHPAYGDDAKVAAVTDWMLDQGCTVFQLFLLDPDERKHSLMVLERLHVPVDAQVVSLGAGVGGMEAYWLQERPDIVLTLVNGSMAQLSRSRCPEGTTLALADMRDVPSAEALGWPGYDVAVLAYSLHHVEDVGQMLDAARACLRPGGTLLVLDVVDGSALFNEVQQYRSPRSVELAEAGLVRLDYGLTWHRQSESLLGGRLCALLETDTVRPSMWVGLA